MIDAVNSTLQDRKITFDGIGINVAANIFLDRMVDSFMASKALADLRIEFALIGAQIRLGRNLLFDDRLEVGGIDVRDVERCDATTAFDQCDNGFVARQLLCVGSVLDLASDIGFIRFNCFALAAQSAGQFPFTHSLANAMRQEPCAFEGYTESAMQLVAANALLRGRHQIHRNQPIAQLDMATFEDSSDLNGEWLPASVALVQTDPVGFAFEWARAVKHAAMWADAPVRPDPRFEHRRRLRH